MAVSNGSGTSSTSIESGEEFAAPRMSFCSLKERRMVINAWT